MISKTKKENEFKQELIFGLTILYTSSVCHLLLTFNAKGHTIA